MLNLMTLLCQMENWQDELYVEVIPCKNPEIKEKKLLEDFKSKFGNYPLANWKKIILISILMKDVVSSNIMSVSAGERIQCLALYDIDELVREVSEYHEF